MLRPSGLRRITYSFLGLFLLISATGKLIDPSATYTVFQAVWNLEGVFAHLAFAALLLVEVGVAGALLLRPDEAWPGLLALSGLVVATTGLLVQGVVAPEVACGCSGALTLASDWRMAILRNIGLATIASASFLSYLFMRLTPVPAS
jgi:hypothetical protein